jgi:hydrogenase-4 component F
MLHLVNHTAAKSMMFLLSGRILERYRTGELRQVSGLLRVMPVTGGMFALGIVALVGLPPFGIFLSKLAMLRAGFAAGHAWLMAAVLALLAVAFIALIVHLNRMLYGVPPAGLTVGESARWALVPMGLCAAVLLVLGVAIPSPLQALLDRIVEITSG